MWIRVYERAKKVLAVVQSVYWRSSKPRIANCRTRSPDCSETQGLCGRLCRTTEHARCRRHRKADEWSRALKYCVVVATEQEAAFAEDSFACQRTQDTSAPRDQGRLCQGKELDRTVANFFAACFYRNYQLLIIATGYLVLPQHPTILTPT